MVEKQNDITKKMYKEYCQELQLQMKQNRQNCKRICNKERNTYMEKKIRANIKNKKIFGTNII